VSWFDKQNQVTLPDGRTLFGGSFRGVAFLVAESEAGGGRRAVVHEFPGKDQPFVEDLGKRATPLRFDAYVIGDDYRSWRDALRAALDGTEGPGELRHPYYGTMRAICTNLSIHESKAAGGSMATLSLEFIETPAQAPSPTVVDDPAGKVSSSADAAATASKAELAKKFDPDGLPAFALASAETALKNAAAALKAKLAPAARAASKLADTADEVTQEIATLAGRVRILTAQASSLVRQPAGLFDGFREAIIGMGGAIEAAPGVVMDALIAAYGTDLGRAAPTTTASRRQERTNQIALIGALRQVIAMEAARLAPLVPYASIEDAFAARARITAMLDEQMLTAGDTVYPTLVQLRADVLSAVPGNRALARVVTIEVREPIPVDVLAYRLYGSVDLADDIIARNKIRHPLFVSGVLKVLSNAN
jgi:prophage DNA circulation protein